MVQCVLHHRIHRHPEINIKSDMPTDEAICSEIDGLSINTGPETTGVLSMIQEAPVCAEIPTVPSVSFLPGSQDAQDLKEYFRRPRMITSGVLSASKSTLVSTTVFKGSFDSWLPNWTIRLAGVAGIRFTMVFTVTVAANPFHGGTVALAWQYAANENDSDQFVRANNSILCTHLPHVRLDVAESTMVQLTIPWKYPAEYLPLGSATQNALGVFGLNQIIGTPTLTSSAAPTYRVLFHLEDLELIGSYPMTETFLTPQAGGRVHDSKSGVGASTKEARSSGLLSSSLKVASKVAGVAAMVPSLSAVGGATSWALNLAAKTAASFGYSKPRDETHPMRRYGTDYIGENNADMPSSAFSLGLMASNTMRIDETMPGTDVDEMSFSHILPIYSQLAYFPMATTNTMGTRLWAASTNPTNFWYRTKTTVPVTTTAPYSSNLGGAANAYYPTNLQYWAQFFRYWRGSLKFKVTFGKCKFHAGRVIVGFVPFPRYLANTGPDTFAIPVIEVNGVGPQPFSYTEIWDLKDGNVFEFEVPWLYERSWCGTNCSTGGVSMTVFDPLIANGEASTSINVLVEVAAGSDFEFSAPRAPSIYAFTGVAPTAVLQAGAEDDDASDVPVASPPDEPPAEPESGAVGISRDVREYTVGEAVTSLKQLLMLPTQCLFNVAANLKSTVTLPSFMYLPRITPDSPLPNPTRAYLFSNRAGLIATCFAYYQGSTSYDIYADKADTILRVHYTPGDNAFAVGLPGGIYGGGGAENNLKVNTADGALHVVAPHYAQYPRCAWRAYFDNAARNWSPSTNIISSDNSAAVPSLTVSTNSETDILLNISGAEDARVASFIGPPPLLLLSNLQTLPPNLGGI